MLQQPFLAMLNHLLVQSGWALARLAKFGGRTARLELFPFVLTCTIREDGTLAEAEQGASADAVCSIAPSLLPRLALHEEAALEQVERSGDAALIEEILFLARNLRWDAAEDLSRVTGDIAAERIVGFARGVQQQIGRNALNLAQAWAEYWTEERPLVAKPGQIAAFARGVSALARAAEELEQRLQQLTKAG